MNYKQKGMSQDYNEILKNATTFLAEEKDTGNVEYKLTLQFKTTHACDKMVTQMRYRMNEGNGLCKYYIGVADNGAVVGISAHEYQICYDILTNIANENNYTIEEKEQIVVDKPHDNQERNIHVFWIREKQTFDLQDIKVACAGNVDSGKCFAHNTQIRLADGRIKKVQDIVIGDKVHGDDGTTRLVKQTTSGNGNLYTITPLDGLPFTINKNHILCFRTILPPTIFVDEQKKVYKIVYLERANGSVVYRAYQLDYTIESMIAVYQYCAQLINGPNVIKPDDVVMLTFANYVHLDRNVIDCLALYRVPNYGIIKFEHLPALFPATYGDTINDRLVMLDNINAVSVRFKESIGFYVANLSTDIIEDLKMLVWTLGMNARLQGGMLYISGEVLVNYIYSGLVEGYSLVKIENITIEKHQTKYYGFELDGNRLFCHLDSVVSHNSTILGVLLTGQNDNGRGSARQTVFNYPHEHKTGQTSSISQKILGFDQTGAPVQFKEKTEWADIVNNSKKLVTFFDLCGHEKYLKTTITGLTAQKPDLVLIMVGANNGIQNMTKEHISLCLALELPFAFVITKVDMCADKPAVLENTISMVKKICQAKEVRRTFFDVTAPVTIQQVYECAFDNVIPIFYTSNVTLEGIDNLHKFLWMYPSTNEYRSSVNQVEMQIDQTWRVPGVKIVVGGQLIRGRISVNDKLLLGPRNNRYQIVQVRSIHCKKVEVNSVEAGCYVCLGLNRPARHEVRRGMVLISINDKPVQAKKFKANITVARSHSTTVKHGYEPIVNVGMIRQTARIGAIQNKKCSQRTRKNRSNPELTDLVLRSGDSALVTCEFSYQPEFISVGERIILTENRVRITGTITDVTYSDCQIEK